ncbi:MAG: potassium transporter TrkG [Pseudomonadota bacterium]
MRYRTIFHILGVILLLIAAAMGIPTILGLIDGTGDALPLGLSTGITLAVGLGLYLSTRRSQEDSWLTHRDGYLATVLGWLLASLAGAIPFFLFAHLSTVDPAWVPDVPPGTPVCALPVDTLHPGREFCSVTDAVFESVSGFTTTGASVIRAGLWDALDAPTSQGRPGLPRALLLWRSLIQWLGGMGILVLAVTVLGLIGVGGMHLMKAEVPGPTPGRLSPRIADTARILWWVYALVSLGEVVALLAGGMDLYNAICHTCTTMATGGFSTLAASVGGMAPRFQWIITFFMFLAGANFALHWALLFRRSFGYHRDAEFRLYLFLVIGGSGLLLWSLYAAGMHWGVEETTRHATFQLVSILTTTGFATQDFGTWAMEAQFLLLVAMFIGGCAGSTGGGIKVIRLQVTTKAAYRELRHIASPRSVSTVRVGHSVVKEPTVSAILGVVSLFVGTFVVSSMVMAAMGLDLVTATSSVAACLGNIGPGLGGVGPAANFHFIPTAGKWLLTFNMIAGRLEIYTVLILFSPHFWRR